MARKTGPLARPQPTAPQRQTSPIVIEDTPAPRSRKRPAIPLADISSKSVADYSSGPIIKVTVGTAPHQRTHQLHESLLTEKSEYFATCLSTPMRESTDKHITLPEDDPDAFGFLVNWAYTGSISSKLAVMECISAYILADKLMMVTELFGDSILLAFVDAAENRREKVTVEHVLALLESGLTESTLMDLAIECFAKSVAEGVPEEQPNGEDWLRLLGAEASVTVRVLGALKKKWQAVASGLEEVDAASIMVQAGSRSTSGASNGSAEERARAKKRRMNDGSTLDLTRFHETLARAKQQRDSRNTSASSGRRGRGM